LPLSANAAAETPAISPEIAAKQIAAKIREQKTHFII
jgi:hypothetical protein